jgi:hypothetical protein
MSEGNQPVKSSGLFETTDGKTIEIREVWASNLDQELELIQTILEKYPYVSMVCLFDFSPPHYLMIY